VTNSSQIVQGGGWKDARVERIKLKAWSMLFIAIVSGGVVIIYSGSFLIYANIPPGLCFLTSLVFFVWEKPREVSFPRHRVGGDIRNLYGASGQPDGEQVKKRRIHERE
jgi:hypothetical protein